MTRPQAELLATALLLGISLPVPGEEELGRLFYTPEQRQLLDWQTQHPGGAPAPALGAPTLVLNGLVQRSRGPQTLWINGQSLSAPGREAPPPFRYLPRHPGALLLPASPRRPALTFRVGETWQQGHARPLSLLEPGHAASP